jgi:hypothetical protein
MIKKMKEAITNFGFNVKIFLMKFLLAREIGRLKRSRRSMYSFHLDNIGISEETAMSLTFRDTLEQEKRVKSIIRKISRERKRIVTSVCDKSYVS